MNKKYYQCKDRYVSFNRLVRTTVLDFLKNEDRKEEQDRKANGFNPLLECEKLAKLVVFEEKAGYIEMRIDGDLWGMMNTNEFCSEFGYVENDFPERFDKALEDAGLIREPYTADTHYIVKA
jgi:hypothetical protein